MDTTRPITDYEVECNLKQSSYLTFGRKYQLLKDKITHWLIIDDEGDIDEWVKRNFSEPKIRTDLPPTVTPNPDTDLLDKFAIAIAPILLSQSEDKDYEEISSNSYCFAHAMLQERKKFQNK